MGCSSELSRTGGFDEGDWHAMPQADVLSDSEDDMEVPVWCFDCAMHIKNLACSVG